MIEVYIDGASAGDPGPSGAGIFIKNKGELLRYAVPLDIMSNHEAEFQALIEALKICKDYEFGILSIRTDSQILDDALDRRYVKKSTYRHLLDQALNLIDKHFDHVFVKWIPSKQNKEADQLARRAIQRSKEKKGT
ncbi:MULTISPECIES: reverse transcriptase-like protein [Bacillaceae]|uniref:Reverse transcriptase-like protein n=1 Tax=Evansella alkalicola TaxID=745819 RepID=A0ABS6JW02_9BACI|nr:MULTISPECIES: reverse transcriptase-like protein [Bacillaceae]MBU9721422.1 reverse transcriptase-like protein [Bacillus alkalicola]